MRRRRRDPSVLGSPILVGALTVLVVIVAVALAYNANTGLPFVPSYNLHVQAANASELQKGDDVNMGGALVGLVSSVVPTRTRSGSTFLYSFRFSSAIGRPLRVRVGTTLETNPTSAPPMFTSSPFCSSLALAACTCRL